jgi:lipopolysaccharide export system permease protein
LSADNELIALRSNGVSVPRVCVSLAFVALVCTAISLWLNVQVAPAAQEKLRSSLYDLATRNPMALFGSDQVIDEFPGRKIYVGKKDGNKLENITVFEMNEQSIAGAGDLCPHGNAGGGSAKQADSDAPLRRALSAAR